ncbi:MAG: DUF2911 domain-containing protein [Runella slithyformis]|nr:MAG: DUF2911 domain-containing protein [Runella slithyformis]TAG20861.1 MAG: DUF2911 domain-containing protein [Cytophagales bacterium]TAG40000.1 MAG: DUF2911 domain-containing protein [Cytophagia bacterium]TAF27453.1 MAG: DUF2911 domain-containing protein [Runella slithyformis]TAF46017.1 MAG: DUF2911 domain-containing protein [Runella slithyformis]
MKTQLFFTLALAAVASFSIQAQINTPSPSPSATVSQGVGLAKVSIEYSRPSLRGRKMFGTPLAAYGSVWRTGANKIPNLTFSQEVMIEGKKIAAGTYGLFTIPAEGEWTIILSKNPNQWGAYDYKEADDALRVKVKAEKLAKSEEHFTMEFTDFTPTSAKITIRWENAQAKFTVSHDPDAQIMAEIKEKTTAATVSADTYSAAANYYYDTNRDLQQAYEWASKVVEKDQKYWTYFLRGKIAAKIGKCDVAIGDAEKGLKLAKEANDGAYIVNHTKVLKDCGK